MLLSHQLGIGGSERQVSVTALSLDPNRFTVHVGCFHEGFRADDLRAAGVPVIRLPVTSFKNWSVIRGARLLGSYIREHGIELIHTFDAPLTVFGVPVARAYRTPVVLSSQRAHRELAGAYRPLLRLTDRMVDRIVVNCGFIKDHLISEEGVDPERVRLCYNGIDTTIFHPHGRCQPDAASVTIGTACALRPEKDLATLLKAFASVCERNPQHNLRLLIIGSGPMLQELQDLAASLLITERTRFQPTTTAVADWLRQIDIFVLPSLSEAFSNSLLEAMACGCTVVASRVGGNPEAVSHGETGLLFDAGDVVALSSQLETLMNTSEYRRELACKGGSRVNERFSVKQCATKMMEIYEEALAIHLYGQDVGHRQYP